MEVDELPDTAGADEPTIDRYVSMRLAQAWPFGGGGSVWWRSVARRFHRVVASASQNFVA